MVRLIVGAILLLIALPMFGMSSMMYGGMMGRYFGYSSVWFIIPVIVAGLGIYLIIKSLEEKRWK